MITYHAFLFFFIENQLLISSRPFYIKTSSASVYPSHSMDKAETDETTRRAKFVRTVEESSKIKEICPW